MKAFGAGSEAFAALRQRIGQGDPGLLAALDSAERAYETAALERASLQSRLASSSSPVQAPPGSPRSPPPTAAPATACPSPPAP